MPTTVSSLSIEPLLSCIVTLCALILLYFPPALRFTFSPVLVLAAVLLLYILRLGAVQGPQNPNTEGRRHERSNLDKVDNSGSLSINVENRERRYFNPNPNPDFEESFVEWDVSAPLGVIYEEYEGEENVDQPNPHPTPFSRLDRYPSLSMYYPGTDSDSSSDGGFSVTEEWESPESVSFTWEEEDMEGSLIEIALDHSEQKKDPSFHVEEDNFIEIDIFPVQN